MALKDIWQQDRQTRQAELKVRQEAVVELRSQHQSERAAMAKQLRAELSQVLPKLRMDEADRLVQSAAIDLMLQETRETRETGVAELFERFAEEKLDRQAAVQAIRDYVWGDATPTPVTADAIESLLELVVKSEVSPAVKAVVKSIVTEPIAKPAAELSLTEKLLTTVSSLSGVRLSDLESTLSVTRSELVQALQQLIRSGDIVQRDRAYYGKTQSKPQTPARI